MFRVILPTIRVALLALRGAAALFTPAVVIYGAQQLWGLQSLRRSYVCEQLPQELVQERGIGDHFCPCSRWKVEGSASNGCL